MGTGRSEGFLPLAAALASAGLAGLPGIVDRLMALYDELEAYPEAREAVDALSRL